MFLLMKHKTWRKCNLRIFTVARILFVAVRKSLRSISKIRIHNLHSVKQYAREYQLGLNSFYTEESYLAIAKEIFYVHDFDLIFFKKLDEKFGFAELGKCILQQVQTFMRQEKLERCLKVEGVEPSAPWYHRRIFKVGHQKRTNFTSGGSCPGSSCLQNLSEFAVSYCHSTAQVSEKFVSRFSCFPWSIRWRFQMIIGKIRPHIQPSKTFKNFFGYSDQW